MSILSAEAKKRLGLLGVSENTIECFDNGIIEVSKDGNCVLLNKEEWEMVKNFTDEYGGVVYHVVATNDNRILLMFVPDNMAEWEEDKRDILNMRAIVAEVVKDAVGMYFEFERLKWQQQKGVIVLG